MAKTPNGFSESDPLAMKKELVLHSRKIACGFARTAFFHANQPVNFDHTKEVLKSLLCCCVYGGSAMKSSIEIGLRELSAKPAL